MINHPVFFIATSEKYYLCILRCAVCFTMGFGVTKLNGQAVALGPWLQEAPVGNSVTGTGGRFTATPVAITIEDNEDNFAERNAARQRIYQVFGTAVDFSNEGDTIEVKFDATFAGPIKSLDSDFRMSLIDTSTNQGFYAISWDTGVRAGTYNRARFVDNLDGGAAPFEPHGGLFTDAVNGSGTIGQTGASPTENNGAIALGLVDGNTLSFSVVLTRDAGDSFSFTTNATEQNGDVIWGESSGSYDPVNPSDGDTNVRGEAINRFDGIAFGIFDDDPFSDYSGDHSYTVSNLSITTLSTPFSDDDGDGFSRILELALGTDPDVADFDANGRPAIERDENGGITLSFGRGDNFMAGTSLIVERSLPLAPGSFEEVYRFEFDSATSTPGPGITEDLQADQFIITDETPALQKAFYRLRAELL